MEKPDFLLLIYDKFLVHKLRTIKPPNTDISGESACKNLLKNAPEMREHKKNWLLLKQSSSFFVRYILAYGLNVGKCIKRINKKRDKKEI